MADIKVGDVVRLKSGGPDMVLFHIQTEIVEPFSGTSRKLTSPYYWCKWFNNKKTEEAKFSKEELEFVK